MFKEPDIILPEIYAYTGIDYLPAFYRKGKVRLLLLMTKKQELVDAFIVLGNLDLSNNIIVDIEKFTCHIFGYPKNKCINGVLKAEFDKKCELKPGYNSLALNLWIQQHYHHAQTYYCSKLNGCVM